MVNLNFVNNVINLMKTYLINNTNEANLLRDNIFYFKTSESLKIIDKCYLHNLLKCIQSTLFEFIKMNCKHVEIDKNTIQFVS